MAERLASGRHHLTRDQVAANQQERLFEALATVMTENGYGNTTVNDLIKEAKVSRATFYQHFNSKHDCFASGQERMQRLVIDAILVEAPTAGTPMQRFADMLDKYLNFLAGDPRAARLYLVEVYAAGPDAVRRRVELQQGFVAAIAKVFKARSKADRFACRALVAAIATLVTNTLATGDAVTALKEPILIYTERAMGPLAAGLS